MNIIHFSVYALALLCHLSLSMATSVPRRIKIVDRQFVLTKTNKPIVMSGPNVIVKGPPYLPSVEGDSICTDVYNADCQKTGTCSTCTTFNEADVKHLKARGWNTIRLGVVWAGAQPRDEDSLDPEFLRRLHAILSLCDRTGIHVLLDNHADMTGTANCGNGMPMWFQKKAAPHLIGRPLSTGFPYSLVSELRVSSMGSYSHCGNNASMWAEHAGDANYNLLNQCCVAMNSGSNQLALGWSQLAQASMDYMLRPGEGRAAFARYWRLLAVQVSHCHHAVIMLS